MTQAAGLALHQRMAPHQDSALADVKECNLGRPDVRDLAKQPAWLGTFFFDEGMPSEFVLRTLPLVPSLTFRASAASDVYAPGLMAFYSQFFKFWRGGFKIFIQFTASQFTSATVRVTHNTYNELTTDMEEKAGSRVSEVVEIRGNTKWRKTIPYMSFKPWSPVIGFRDATRTPLALDAALDSLEITVLNPATSTADNGDSSIYYSIYVCGGDDIDFKDYCGFTMRKAVNELAALEKAASAPKKQSLKSEFTMPFEPMHPGLKSIEFGYVKSDTQTNVVELGHQEIISDYTTITDNPLWPWFDDGSPSTLHMLLQPFLAHRGSTNIRLVADPNMPIAGLKMGSETDPALSVSSWQYGKPWLWPGDQFVYGESPTPQPDTCINVPFISETIAHYKYPDCDEDVRSYDPWIDYAGPVMDPSTFVSLGDDYMVGLPFTAPLFTIADPPVFIEPSDKMLIKELLADNQKVPPPLASDHDSSSSSSNVHAAPNLLPSALSKMRR